MGTIWFYICIAILGVDSIVAVVWDNFNHSETIDFVLQLVYGLDLIVAILCVLIELLVFHTAIMDVWISSGLFIYAYVMLYSYLWFNGIFE